MDAWTPKAKDVKGYIQECYEASANWHSLSSFFESRGYILYDYPSLKQGAIPPKRPKPSEAIASNPDPYPYARRLTTEDSQLFFTFIQCMRVWPARDMEGREVILRLVASPEESHELEVYKRLNTPQARQDPRNHTVPVLDWLTHGEFTFVVMPRWDIIALARSEILFTSVSELLDVAETLFEGLEFLHENRIAHRDITEENIVMNALVNPNDYYFTLRDPATVRYAYIDYDCSLILPGDTDNSKVSVPRLRTARNYDLKLPAGPCNPFEDDVRALAYTLQRIIRHIESEVPEIGRFFERLLKGGDAPIQSASQALGELRGIRSRLTQSELCTTPTGLFWYPNRIKLIRDDPDGSKALARFKESQSTETSSVNGTVV